jgi:dolichol-phosphate mannosyltransferase
MASDAAPERAVPTLSIIVPTYKESKNVPILFERITAALGGMPWEMIVVDDDSPDGTSNVAFGLAAADSRLRCLRRVNRSGLAGAVIEGWMSSSADFVAVIDGDLQHDESILLAMYQALAKGSGDLVVGTRLRDASEGTLSPARQRLSDLGAWFFRRIAGATVSDPMSGFFMIRREIVSRLAPRLSPDGFKILVDVILSAGGGLNIVEVPYAFRKRHAGESKLTPLVGIDFLGVVVHHATAGTLPTRFVLFAMIGASVWCSCRCASAVLNGQYVDLDSGQPSRQSSRWRVTFRTAIPMARSVPWPRHDHWLCWFCAWMQRRIDL